MENISSNNLRQLPIVKAENTDESVQIKRSGSNVTWIFRNEENEAVEFDMSFIRATTITALLKRSLNQGQGDAVKPRIHQGTQTELYVYPHHCAIVFDQNPKLKLVRNPQQVSDLIRDLEEVAA